MGLFGGVEWIIILVVVVFLFGAKRIPQLANGMGQVIREFRDARMDEEDECNIDT